ncbi:hypothetical protein [Streptomyces sp. NPDC056061]|uniref:hypothetical protein n=1 Tax=Streptomyces sp. NPDC056061 TaxID=3345700 RepID=UPI0035D62F7D
MFDPIQPPSTEEMKHALTTGLLEAAGLMEPLYDFADGMRRDLESRGWSPPMAEHVACAWLAATVAAVAGGGK